MDCVAVLTLAIQIIMWWWFSFLKQTNPDGTVEIIGPDNKLVPFYCLFLSIWSTIFLELWKRRCAELAFAWDVMDFEEEEKARPEFTESDRPVLQNGFYGDAGFIQVHKGEILAKMHPTHQ